MEAIEPIRFEHGRPMLVGGLRRHHTFAESGRGITEQWVDFLSMEALPGQRGSTTYGIMCGADPDGFEYMCGVEVEALEALPAGTGRMRIQGQTYAVFAHHGCISEIRSTWERIYSGWLPSSPFESAHKPDFEVYDDRFDPEAGTGLVEIWVSIVPLQK